ncbi:hypothetical protein [Burkholderia sp. MSMB1459WGS]|uniref:hypothetical protein n=1 Tax=Burkholderia sp. MSMB1459WGS TaxID=1637970 RepID=UPI000AFCEB90|nr:hypothetical protein [Burkholderia sp. MSMB1459WGS]
MSGVTAPAERIAGLYESMKALAGSMPRSIGGDSGVRRRHAGGTLRGAREIA